MTPVLVVVPRMALATQLKSAAHVVAPMMEHVLMDLVSVAYVSVVKPYQCHLNKLEISIYFK